MASWDDSQREDTSTANIDEEHLDEENYYSMLNLSKDVI